MSSTPIEKSLRSAETGIVVMDGRLLCRIIKRHRRIVGLGLQVPHSHCYWMPKEHLFELCPADEVGIPKEGLPEALLLLPRPKGAELYAKGQEEVLTKLWRSAFHARVHCAVEELHQKGLFDDAKLRARIDRIGQTELDEIRRVLRSDDLLLPPSDDRAVYGELAALLLELSRFAPALIPRYFPTLRDVQRALSVVSEDLNVEELLKATRPEGAREPKKTAPSKDSTTPTYSALPALDLLPPFMARRATTSTAAQKLVVQADKAKSENNHVRSVLLRFAAIAAAGEEQEVKLRAAIRADLETLGARLDKALAPPDGSTPPAPTPWTSSLLPLAATANERQALRYPVEARLLYDLQRACVAHERGASAIDIITWALSLGKRPIVRKLPATRVLKIARYLRGALTKLRHVEMPNADRRLLARLLRSAVKRAEDNVRITLRPVLEGTLDAVGLQPETVPERVARKKVVEELCDQAVARGFLSIAELRDALSRNQLKLRDVGLPREIVLGDPLLLADRSLDIALDGVYRRGEIYLRLLQKVSSLFFGTIVGRFLTMFVILPVGGAYVALEGLSHILAIGAKVLHLPHPHLATPIPVGVTSLVIFGLLHSEGIRAVGRRAMIMLGHALASIFIHLPKWVLALPRVRQFLESELVRTFARFVLMPLVLATILYIATPLHDVGGAIGPLGAAGVFVAASVLLNTRLGLVVQEVVLDQLAELFEALKHRAIPGLIRLIMGIFRAMLELSERMLYRVDEWLRFREGDRRATIPLKAALGFVWFFVAYVIRLYVTLLIEPEINPVKHFPVVTVAQKMCLSILQDMLRVMNHALAPLGSVIGGTIAGTTVFLFPSVFGFLVWELKENFKLYKKNRRTNLTPIAIGHHGETVGTLLRPGFHSGTVPKLYEKIRKAARKADLDESVGKPPTHSSLRGFQDGLDDVKEEVRRAVDREVALLLGAFPRFTAGRVSVKNVDLGSNRIRVELICEPLSKQPCVVTFEEQSDMLVASITEPGFVDVLPQPEQRLIFENALAGFYRVAGVDLVREQIRVALGNDTPYDISEDGLVLWPDEHYRTEVIYRLDPGLSGPLVTPVVSGAPPKQAPAPLDLRKILFRDQHVSWADWIAAWREDRPANEPIPRVLFGISILPAARGSSPR